MKKDNWIVRATLVAGLPIECFRCHKDISGEPQEVWTAQDRENNKQLTWHITCLTEKVVGLINESYRKLKKWAKERLKEDIMKRLVDSSLNG